MASGLVLVEPATERITGVNISVVAVPSTDSRVQMIYAYIPQDNQLCKDMDELLVS